MSELLSLKVYVISIANYEYNDEIYYKAGIDSLDVAFISKDKAEKVCLKKNIDFIKGENLNNYFYSLNEVITSSLPQNKIDNILNKFISSEEPKMLDNAKISAASQEDLAELVGILDFLPCSVEEVEINPGEQD